ncbi:hypothetical protein M3Y98_01143800 [Aphelenchoides besseyi]|nr:hypothetical protein M3Y98_01143800 [Aphelenchoides besseyi]
MTFVKWKLKLKSKKIDMEKYREDSKTAIRRYHKKCKEYVDLEQSTSKLYSQLEAVKKESKNVQEQKDAKHEKLMEESRVRLDQLSRENEMLLKELESQSKALQEQKSHQDASIQKLKEEHDRTLQKLKDDFANEAVRAAQAWKNQSIQRLAELNGVVKHLKDEVTEKQQLLLSANAQTELQKIETRTALQTVEELKSTNSQLLKEQKQLKDERDKWIQQHTDTKDQLNNRAKHIADLEREMESLRRDSNNWNHWYHQFFAPTVSNMPSFNSSDSTFGNLLTPEQIETSSVENLPVNLRLLNIKKIG